MILGVSTREFSANQFLSMIEFVLSGTYFMRNFGLTFVVLVLVGCQNSTDTTPPTAQLSATPSTLTQPGTINLKVTADDPAGNGKSSGVQRVEFYKLQNNQSITIGEDLTVPYEYSVQLSASNNGMMSFSAKVYDKAGNVGTSNTVQISINIVQPDSPDFEVAVAGTLSISQGGLGTLEVGLNRKNGFSEPINLSLEASSGSLPQGLAASFALHPANSASTLKITAANDTPAQTYALLVRASGGGITRTAPLNLEIKPKPTAVEVTTFFQMVQQNLGLMAFQDGNGPWQVATGNNGSYRFAVKDGEGRYGVLSLCYNSPTVYQLTLSEVHSFPIYCGSSSNPQPPGSYTISGKIEGLDSQNNVAGIYFNSNRSTVSGETPYYYPSYSLGNFPANLYRIIGVRYAVPKLGPPNPEDPRIANKVVVYENVNVTGDTVVDLDFNGPNAFALEGSYSLDTNQVDPERTYTYRSARYVNPTGWSFLVSQDYVTTLKYPFLPTNRRQSGDGVWLSAAEARRINGPIEIFKFRSAFITLENPRDKTLEFLPYPDATITADSTTAYLRLKADWKVAHGEWYELLYTQYPPPSDPNNPEKPFVSWWVYLSKGWLRQTQSYEVPDFSGLSGWQPQWTLRSNNATNFTVRQRGGTTISEFLNPSNNTLLSQDISTAGETSVFNPAASANQPAILPSMVWADLRLPNWGGWESRR